MTKTNKAIFFATIAAICGSSVLAKYALEVFQPFTLVSARFFIASLALLPFVLKDLKISTFKALLLPAVIGAFNPILLFIALQFTKASVSPLIYASVPAMTAIYLLVIRKEKLSFEQKLGVAVGFFGVILIILFPFLQKTSASVGEIVTGNILIFLASIAFLAYGIISKQKQKKLNASPIELTFYFSVVTFLLSIPFAWQELATQPIIASEVGMGHIVSIIGVGVIGTSLFYFAYQYALKLGSELSASLFTYMQPVFTAIFAIALLGENITASMVIGGLLAVFGSQLASGQLKLKIK
jgi:drug/metabolite transporter (DMT)-like permease